MKPISFLPLKGRGNEIEEKKKGIELGGQFQWDRDFLDRSRCFGDATPPVLRGAEEGCSDIRLCMSIQGYGFTKGNTRTRGHIGMRINSIYTSKTQRIITQ